MESSQFSGLLDLHFEDCLSIIKAVEQGEDYSLTLSAQALIQKYMIICVASNHERELSDRVIDYASRPPGGSQLIGNFTANKAVNRQYHTWFDWSSNNANQFFKLFGVQFKTYMEAKVKSDDDLRESIQAFVKIGKARNELVHGDLAFCSSNFTISETLDLHNKARVFIELFPRIFDDYLIYSSTI